MVGEKYGERRRGQYSSLTTLKKTFLFKKVFSPTFDNYWGVIEGSSCYYGLPWALTKFVTDNSINKLNKNIYDGISCWNLYRPTTLNYFRKKFDHRCLRASTYISKRSPLEYFYREMRNNKWLNCLFTNRNFYKKSPQKYKISFMKFIN